jgi:outer membrane immunogenic protein
VGVGGEYAFTNNFTGFIEYNYYGFGEKSVTLVNGLGGVYDVVNIKEDKSVVKIGVNWKFGKGPVVANY